MTSTTGAWDRLFSGGEPFATSFPPLTNGHGQGAHDHAHRGREAPNSGGKRLDIQGLRAVAVVDVVINHLTGHPVGGFIGVDVFFVISGFLITSHLVRDLPRTSGPVQYVGDFYRRRIRRLFPAALLVIVLTVAVSRVLLDSVRFHQAWQDGVYAAIFGANWHLISVQTNYFTATQAPTPFQHYWSLSVEEQFYLIWPIVLFAVGWLFASRHKASIGRRRAVAGAAACVLTTASLVWAFTQSSANSPAAYFSTFTRGWELGIGALLACAIPYLRAPHGLITLMSWTGLLLIGIATFVTHGQTGFPAPGAILPCAGSALVIAAVSKNGVGAFNPILTNRLAVGIGDISYSVYLVHFPVIILLSAEMPSGGSYFYVACVALILGLSILLYAGVERPILDSTWLLPARERGRDRDRMALRLPLLASIVATVVGLGAYAMWPGEASTLASEHAKIEQELAAHRPAQPRAALGQHHPRQRRKRPLRPKLAALQRQIKGALRATRYPSDLSPTMEQANSGPITTKFITDCSLGAPSFGTCTVGSGRHTVMIVGDSTASVYAEALQQVVEHTPGWRLVIGSGWGCNFSAIVYTGAGLIPDGCAARNRADIAEIRALHPDLVLITNAYEQEYPLNSSQLVSVKARSQAEGDIIKKIERAARHVALVAPPPGGMNFQNCYQPSADPVQCVTTESSEWTSVKRSEQALASQLRISYVDSSSWFCDTAAMCPPFVGQTPVYRDSVHATPAYMTKVWPVIREALRTSRLLK